LPRELKTVIRDYYSALQRAFKTKDLDGVKQCLAEDAHLIGIHEFFEGRESILDMFSKFIFMINTLDIQRQYFDHESSCTVMDIVTLIPDVRIAHIEWIVVKDGHVEQIHTVYDTKAWQKFMQLMQTRNNETSYPRMDKRLSDP
jgi:hypothetical protein